eukprot:gene53324-65993_t
MVLTHANDAPARHPKDVARFSELFTILRLQLRPTVPCSVPPSRCSTQAATDMRDGDDDAGGEIVTRITRPTGDNS